MLEFTEYFKLLVTYSTHEEQNSIMTGNCKKHFNTLHEQSNTDKREMEMGG